MDPNLKPESTGSAAGATGDNGEVAERVKTLAELVAEKPEWDAELRRMIQAEADRREAEREKKRKAEALAGGAKPKPKADDDDGAKPLTMADIEALFDKREAAAEQKRLAAKAKAAGIPEALYSGIVLSDEWIAEALKLMPGRTVGDTGQPEKKKPDPNQIVVTVTDKDREGMLMVRPDLRDKPKELDELIIRRKRETLTHFQNQQLLQQELQQKLGG